MVPHPKTHLLTLVVVACITAFAVNAKQLSGDPQRGRILYTNICSGCHSLDANRVGPMHRGVYGRKAGSVPDYEYSPALKASKVVWDEKTLDSWLAGPERFIPGQRMNVDVSDPSSRANIIAYLHSVSPQAK